MINTEYTTIAIKSYFHLYGKTENNDENTT